MSEISVKFGFALSSIHNKIRKFEAENPELAENMKKKVRKSFLMTISNCFRK